MDLTTLTDEELAALRTDAQVEQARRDAVAVMPDQIDDMVRRYLSARGEEQGGPWRAPTAAHESYPKGWEVTHAGKRWVSETPGNVQTPGEPGWRQS